MIVEFCILQKRVWNIQTLDCFAVIWVANLVTHNNACWECVNFFQLFMMRDIPDGQISYFMSISFMLFFFEKICWEHCDLCRILRNLSVYCKQHWYGLFAKRFLNRHNREMNFLQWFYLYCREVLQSLRGRSRLTVPPLSICGDEFHRSNQDSTAFSFSQQTIRASSEDLLDSQVFKVVFTPR